VTSPLPDARLAEVEQFLDVWDAAPVHRTQYRDVISSQKSGDPEGGRKLRATALRELLAEVRRLRAEVERFRDTLADNRLGFALAAVRMIATGSVTADADLLRRAILEQLAPFGSNPQPEATP